MSNPLTSDIGHWWTPPKAAESKYFRHVHAAAKMMEVRYDMAKKEKRFIRTHGESGLSGNTEIWVDRQTGINYLFHFSGYAGGMTPLLNRDGTPVITTVYDEELD